MVFSEDQSADNCYCDGETSALITYNIPVQPRIEYKYTGGAWQTIYGSANMDYRLEQEPPFRGGQCEDVRYWVRLRIRTLRFSYSSCGDLSAWNYNDTGTPLQGAIHGIEFQQTGTNYHPGCQETYPTGLWGVRHGNNQFQVYFNGLYGAPQSEVEIVSITREDGLPESEEPQFQGGQCPILYNARFNTAQYSGTTFTGWSTFEVLSSQWGGAVRGLNLVQSDFGNNLGLEHHFRSQAVGARTYKLRLYRYNGTTQTINIGGIVYGLRFVGFRTQQPDNCGDPPPTSCGDPPGGDCTFTVFEPGTPEIILHQEVRSECPHLAKFGCEFLKGNEQEILTELLVVPVIWLPPPLGFIEEINECVFVLALHNPVTDIRYVCFLRVVNIEIAIDFPFADILKFFVKKRLPNKFAWLDLILNFTLAEFDFFLLPFFELIACIESPPGCPAPQWSIDCEPNKCPPETVYECDDNGVLCCFDEECNLIKTI